MTDQDFDIASPCVQICCLDERDICIGCYRTAVEITDWTTYTSDQKRDIIKLTHQRYQDKFNND